VLIAYGSNRGGTAGLSTLIASALGWNDLDVEVAAAETVEDLEGYDAVIVGGALYNNRWHPAAFDFVARFRGTLRTLPVWFFSSGPLDDSARSGDLAPIPQVRDLARMIDIRSHMTFGGVLERKRRGPLGGLLAYGPVGDFRDLHQVEAWVERVIRQLDEPRTSVELTEEPALYPDDDSTIARVRRLLSEDDLSLEDDAGLDVLL
jgi:menaquinone-dependent protoporphyrinogen oxidase